MVPESITRPPGVYNRPVTLLRWAACVALTAGAAGLLTGPASAQSCPTGPVPISRITIDRRDVFDAGTATGIGRAVATTANALHHLTRDAVVRRELLFAIGDACDPAVLAQSERHLRALGLFQEVAVSAVPAGMSEVHVRVRVRDAWTLKVGMNLSREGGFTSWTAKAIDTNTAGTGIALNLRRDHSFERDVTAVAVGTTRAFGSRHRVDAFIDRRSDGSGTGLTLAKPFVTVDDPWNYTVSFVESRDHARVYDRGTVDAEYGRYAVDAIAAVTWRAAGEPGRTAWRVTAGYKALWREYAELSLAAATALPPSRRFMGPAVAAQVYRERFVKRRGLGAPERDVDVNLGFSLDTELFVSPGSTFPGTDPRAFAGVRIARGWSPSDRWLILARSQAGLWFSGGEPARHAASAFAGVWWQPSESTVRRLTLELEGLNRPEAGQRVYLGGTAGLRAYRQNAFAGAMRALAILEERRFAAWTPLGLFRPGVAIFAEAGTVGRRPGGGRTAAAADIGIGLRIASLRAAGSAIVAADVAWPLVAEPGRRRRPQLVVGYRGDF